MNPFEWLDIAGKANTAENIAYLIGGFLVACILFKIISFVRNNFKVVMGIAAFIVAVAFLLSVV